MLHLGLSKRQEWPLGPWDLWTCTLYCGPHGGSGLKAPSYRIPCEIHEDMASVKPFCSPFLLPIPPSPSGAFSSAPPSSREEDRKPPHVRMGQELWSEDLLKVHPSIKTAKELEKNCHTQLFHNSGNKLKACGNTENIKSRKVAETW